MTLTLLTLWLVAEAKRPAPPPAPPVDPWSEAGLAQATAELVPRIEAHAGRAFVTPPVVRFSDPERFRALLAAESKRLYERVLADTPVEVRERMAEAGAGMTAASVLGKYGVEDRVTYVCPDVIRDALPGLGLADSAGWDVMRLILAHELTHALNDQHTPLDAMLTRISDAEGLQASSAAWEGFATWTEQQVAADLGLTPTFDALTHLQGWGPDGLDSPSAWPIYASYGLGRDFVAWQHGQGGAEQVWAVLAAPPLSTAVISHPERWKDPLPTPRIDYAAVLRGLDQEMTTGEWSVANSRLGEQTLRGEALSADADAELVGLLGHLTWAQELSGERPDRQISLRILEFDDPSAVKQYLELLERQQGATSDELSQATGVPIDVIWEPFTEVEADESGLRTQRIPLPGGRWAESRSAWVVRGPILVVVTAVDFRPGLRLGNTVRAVFSRLDAVSAAHPSP